MGNNKFNRLIKRETKFLEKKTMKHKHHFNVKCILEINMLDNKREYFNVLKCEQCNSFISNSESNNIQGHIFDKFENKDNLPILVANVSKRNLIIPFSYIKSVQLRK